MVATSAWLLGSMTPPKEVAAQQQIGLCSDSKTFTYNIVDVVVDCNFFSQVPGYCSLDDAITTACPQACDVECVQDFVVDCDGNEVPLDLVGDGVCHDGSHGDDTEASNSQINANLNCEMLQWDGEDCINQIGQEPSIEEGPKEAAETVACVDSITFQLSQNGWGCVNFAEFPMFCYVNNGEPAQACPLACDACADNDESKPLPGDGEMDPKIVDTPSEEFMNSPPSVEPGPQDGLPVTEDEEAALEPIPSDVPSLPSPTQEEGGAASDVESPPVDFIPPPPKGLMSSPSLTMTPPPAPSEALPSPPLEDAADLAEDEQTMPAPMLAPVDLDVPQPISVDDGEKDDDTENASAAPMAVPLPVMQPVPEATSDEGSSSLNHSRIPFPADVDASPSHEQSEDDDNGHSSLIQNPPPLPHPPNWVPPPSLAQEPPGQVTEVLVECVDSSTYSTSFNSDWTCETFATLPVLCGAPDFEGTPFTACPMACGVCVPQLPDSHDTDQDEDLQELQSPPPLPSFVSGPPAQEHSSPPPYGAPSPPPYGAPSPPMGYSPPSLKQWSPPPLLSPPPLPQIEQDGGSMLMPSPAEDSMPNAADSDDANDSPNDGDPGGELAPPPPGDASSSDGINVWVVVAIAGGVGVLFMVLTVGLWAASKRKQRNAKQSMKVHKSQPQQQFSVRESRTDIELGAAHTY